MIRVAKATALIIPLILVLTLVMGTASLAEENVELPEELNKAAGEGYRYIQVIGSVIAVAILVFYGVSWIIATPDQKAALKEKVGVYIIGAILLYAGASITVWFIDMLAGAFGHDLSPFAPSSGPPSP